MSEVSSRVTNCTNEESKFDSKSFLDFYNCQFKVLFKTTSQLNKFDRILLLSRRLYSALLRRIKKFREAFAKNENNFKETIQTLENDFLKINQSASIKEGDMVQILPFHEINKKLDEKGKTQGLQFMEGMERFCGKSAKVMKKVKYIYDEKEMKMRKCKNVVILEGVICDGKGTFSSEDCDRCCFFFWKESWLKRI